MVTENLCNPVDCGPPFRRHSVCRPDTFWLLCFSLVLSAWNPHEHLKPSSHKTQACSYQVCSSMSLPFLIQLLRPRRAPPSPTPPRPPPPPPEPHNLLTQWTLLHRPLPHPGVLVDNDVSAVDPSSSFRCFLFQPRRQPPPRASP